MFAALMPILGPILNTVAGSLFPNPEDEIKRLQLQQQIPMLLAQQAGAIEAAAADIVRTEAASQHWLAANWRPLTMLTFVALIVARFLGWGAPNVTEAEYLRLWDLMTIGLGGYVGGRTIEKVAPTIAAALKK